MQLSAGEKLSLRIGGYTAVYALGTAKPIPRHIGDTVGAWPVRFGITRSFADEITKQALRYSPFEWQGVLFRVWTRSSADADALAVLVEQTVTKRGCGLPKPWFDMTPSFDESMFEFEVHDIARRAGIEHGDDNWLLSELRKDDKRRVHRFVATCKSSCEPLTAKGDTL